jgi:hypothetical protein
MSRRAGTCPTGAAQTNRLKQVLAAGVQDIAAKQKRKGPSLDKQTSWLLSVVDGWRNMVAYYSAAILWDSYMLPEAEVEALRKQYEDLDTLFFNMKSDFVKGTLELPKKLQSLGDAKNFVWSQLNDEQKKVVRYARLNGNEDDFF